MTSYVIKPLNLDKSLLEMQNQVNNCKLIRKKKIIGEHFSSNGRVSRVYQHDRILKYVIFIMWLMMHVDVVIVRSHRLMSEIMNINWMQCSSILGLWTSLRAFRSDSRPDFYFIFYFFLGIPFITFEHIDAYVGKRWIINT